MAVHIYNRQFKNKVRVYKILARFPGIGRSRVNYILALAGLTKRANASHLGWYKAELLSFYVRVLFIVDSKFFKYRNFYLYRINSSGNYKSSRFEHGMPVRGQRTHTNAKTSRSQRGRFSVMALSI